MAPKGPYKLCTVNKVPERAKLVVGRFIESVKDNCLIDHAENAASMFALSLLRLAGYWGFRVCITMEAKYSNCEQG
jgi:hypothetical protein